MISGQIEFGLSQEVLDMLAVKAVKESMMAESEQLQPNLMDGYDMTYKLPVPTWRDVVMLPFGLATFGVLYVRDLYRDLFIE